MGRFSTKTQNCLFKMKLVLSVTLFNCEYAEFNNNAFFFYFKPEIPFLGKFDSKIKFA